jgi:hypothetical protein
MMGAMVSPLRGADGNVEFLAYLAARPATAGSPSQPRPLAERFDAVALAASALEGPSASPDGSAGSPGVASSDEPGSGTDTRGEV